MSWGCDTALYRTAEAMRVEFPARLATGPRVIKRNRGNGGQGVWKVETLATPNSGPMVRVLDATEDVSEELILDEFLARCLEYFEDGCVIDQPFQSRLSEGVVRCYMAGDRCAGFGQQKVKALVDSAAARAVAGPRLYTSNADRRFQRLRRLMKTSGRRTDACRVRAGGGCGTHSDPQPRWVSGAPVLEGVCRGLLALIRDLQRPFTGSRGGQAGHRSAHERLLEEACHAGTLV